MRSLPEIEFRIRQELLNATLYALPPKVPAGALHPAEIFPDPGPLVARLRGGPFADHIIKLARGIMEGNIPLFGQLIQTSLPIAWRRDYWSGKETQPSYFRRIPYLDSEVAGDHKNIWELNRHQHLVILAQAGLFTGDESYFATLFGQLESWWIDNPLQRGINWASALEVAFRALSWMWIYRFARSAMAPRFRERFLGELYRHGQHLRCNLSVYFSPNTHLLGEAVALHALGKFFQNCANAREWERAGARVVREQLDSQVHEDGSHFEQSSHYHVYALDMFLLHAIVAGQVPIYREKLLRMAAFLHHLLGPARRMPLIGDDDGGRLFHPYGDCATFGRSTLATCAALLDRQEWRGAPDDAEDQAAWWLGEEALRVPELTATLAPAGSRLFPDAGLAFLAADGIQAIVDTGPFGPGGAGHSHSDTLSILLRKGDEEILTDSGTYRYVGEPHWRDWFRGSAAHNTVRIDGLDQGTATRPFRWDEKPRVERLLWDSTGSEDVLDARCWQHAFCHRRTIVFVKPLPAKPGVFFILDRIEGPSGQHLIEQFWHHSDVGSHFGFAGGETVTETGGEHGWRSQRFASKEPAPVICLRTRRELPACLAAVILIGDGPAPDVHLVAGEAGVRVSCQYGEVVFPDQGRPAIER